MSGTDRTAILVAEPKTGARQNDEFATAIARLQGDRAMHPIGSAGVQPETAAAITRSGVLGNPRQGLIMGTWGFFIGFAAVALYGPAAHSFQQSMQLSPFLVGLMVAAPQLTGSPVTPTLYPLILLFGCMSGCGVATFSVGIP